MCSAKTQVYENFQETYHDNSWHISNHSNHSWAWSKGLFGLAWCPLTVFSSAFWAAHVRFTLDYLILCCAQSNSSLHIAHDGFPRTIQESVKTCTHTHTCDHCQQHLRQVAWGRRLLRKQSCHLTSSQQSKMLCLFVGPHQLFGAASNRLLPQTASRISKWCKEQWTACISWYIMPILCICRLAGPYLASIMSMGFLGWTARCQAIPTYGKEPSSLATCPC